MIRRQHHQRLRTRNLFREGIEEPAEPSVEPEDLIMNFPGIGAVTVSDSVRRRERGEQEVGRSVVAEVEDASSLECERECEGIHPGIVLKLLGDFRRARKLMREGDVFPAVLIRGRVLFGVRRRRKQQAPSCAGQARRRATLVEGAHPSGERITVVSAGGELPIHPPVDGCPCPTDRQNRAAVLPRHREQSGFGIRRVQPVVQRGPLEPSR